MASVARLPHVVHADPGVEREEETRGPGRRPSSQRRHVNTLSVHEVKGHGNTIQRESSEPPDLTSTRTRRSQARVLVATAMTDAAMAVPVFTNSSVHDECSVCNEPIWKYVITY